MASGPFEGLLAAREVLRRGALSDALFFDPRRYRAENEDVAATVAAGGLRSFYDHYVRYGKWEGRRFALRRWGLDERTAARAFAAAARLEIRLDALACAVTPGEVAHRLRSESGAQPVKPLGPWKHQLDRGPWRAPLPRSARGGWFMVHARVAPVRAPLAFRVVAGHEDAFAMFCTPMRTTRRLIRVPAEARAIEIELLDRRLRTQPVRVRLSRVPEALVERRMLRRIRHHEPRSIGRSEDELRARFSQEAARAGVSPRELMWLAYESTFPRPVARASYGDWIEKVEGPHVAELDRDASERLAKLPEPPRISIVLPVYDPPTAHLRACLASVAAQSYPHWELCIADDGSREEIRALLAEEAARDPRIRLVLRRENGHICRASNDALALATGAWIALLDHDDLLPRHALLLAAEAIAREPDAAVLYGDEDKIDEEGERREPHFKPSFDSDLLLGQNYLGHLFVARTDQVRAVGGFRVGYEGSQDHDLALRLTERLAPHQVVHVPHILYHWRRSDRSTASSASAKPYTEEAGLRAVRDALSRRGEPAVVEPAGVPHCYRVRRKVTEAPLVSVIVPTRDAVDLLSTCIDSLVSRTAYPSFEVIIVDNGSRDPRTHRYFKNLADPRVRVRRDDRPFNFSALNNAAVAEARGEIIVLLNNDIEIIEEHWLTELVAQAIRPEIGCVGAKLLYPDTTIQHAGVVLGLHGLAGHPYRHMAGSVVGYYGRLTTPHAVSAVTAACLAVRREVFLAVDGLDEALAVAFNDVDFCLRVLDTGARNLLVPNVTLLHHESATRGLDQTGAKRKRFLAEVELMKTRWGERLFADPAYSPHLSLDHDDYSIRIPH